jgi:hypothetical protein
MNKKIKKTLNISAIIILAIIALSLIYFTITKDNYKYKLELDDLVIYSDENILNKINELKDSNTIFVIFDTTLNKQYSANYSILYTQLFAYNQKQVPFYIFSENNSCIGHDGNKHTFSKTIESCKLELNTTNYPKIMLGEIKENKKLTIIINNNYYYIIPTSLDKIYSESESFLKLIYPDLDEIAKNIENFIGSVTDNIDSKNMLPK